MIARIATFAFSGIEAVPVEVQVQVSSGLPAFLIVGLPDKAVGESRERVRAALTAMGLSLPPRRVLINLAPADLLKEGSHFDLPVALAVLAAMDILPPDELAGFAAIGELSLDGSLNPVAGVLPAAISASQRDLGLICPAAQGGEAAWAGRIEVLAAPDLLSLINHFRGTQVLTPPEPAGLQEHAPGPDLSEVRGMESARRAIEVAAAGNHNLLMVGPPGAGKSMLAARLPRLLPDLSPEAALQVSMIHSVAGLLDGGRLFKRPPFREPHHGASQAALAGGGQRARPGEVSLAHRGILFLDELPEFPRAALEALRQPLENGRTTVARAAAHVTYPARFQLVAAMNPCRCGHLGDAARECNRAPRCGEDYLGRISGPLLDRIDMIVHVHPTPPPNSPAPPQANPATPSPPESPPPEPPNKPATAPPAQPPTPKRRSTRLPSTPTRGSSRNNPPPAFGFRPEASRVCCGWRERLRTLRERVMWGGCMLRRRWRIDTAFQGEIRSAPFAPSLRCRPLMAGGHDPVCPFDAALLTMQPQEKPVDPGPTFVMDIVRRSEPVQHDLTTRAADHGRRVSQARQTRVRPGRRRS